MLAVKIDTIVIFPQTLFCKGFKISASNRPLRICSFESRRATEMQKLIEKQGGIATVAPSMQEVPLENNTALFDFADAIFAGEIDVVIFMTGVGAETLLAAVETKYARDEFLTALGKCTIGVRGPKPAAVLRKWGIAIDFRASEPNTWRELCVVIDATTPLTGKRVGVQEYGESTPEFYAALEEREATVLPVPVYRWELPTDVKPLRDAIARTIAGDFDVLMWTSANQLVNVLQVAEQQGCQAEWLAAAGNCVIASIGPTASARIRSTGLQVDLEASPPKMGQLVRLIFEQAVDGLQQKK